MVVTKLCLQCSKQFEKKPSVSKREWNDRVKFCSRECSNAWWKGKHKNPANEFKIGHPAPKTAIKKGQHLSPKTEFAKGHEPNPDSPFVFGHTPWNKGKSHTAVMAEKNPLWKGEDAHYSTKHRWLTRRMSRYMCSCCKKTCHEKRLVWANVSGEYRREYSDWTVLCYRCHWYYDRPERKPCHKTLSSVSAMT